MDKSKLLLLFLLGNVENFAEEYIKLPESKITSDYIEINKMKDTKNVIVIDKKIIEEKGYKDLSSVLESIPSINVGKTGWGDIDIRGQGEGNSAKNLQVLVDGAPITTLVNHPLQTNYNVVPVENIERIEIIPGGGSIIYGSGTAGGVINITTNLKRLSKVVNSAEVSIANQGEKYDINLGHKINDKINLQVSYLRDNKDLYFKNTYRKSDYFTSGINLNISDNQNLSFRYSTLNENGQFVRNLNYEKFMKVKKDYVPEERKITLGLDKNGHKIETVRNGYSNARRKFDSYNLSYTVNNKNNIKYLVDLFYNKGNFSNTSIGDLVMYHHTYGVKNKFDIEYGKNTIFDGSSLLIGYDAYKQDSKLEYDDYKMINFKKKIYKTNPLSFKYNKETRAFYFLNTLKLGNWESSQGIRRDYTYWTFDKKAAKNKGKETSHRHNTNYELSLAYKYSDTGRIYSRYERGFTSPDGLEITDDFSAQDIKATKGEDEIYDLYEVGLRDYFKFTTVSLTAFYSKTDNEMTRNYILDPNLGFGRKSINILKTKRKGLEIDLSQKIGKLELKESYSYLKGKRDYNGREGEFLKPDSIVDWSNTGLKKVPKHSLALAATYQFTDRLSAGINYRYSGKYSNFSDMKEKEEEGYISSYSITDLNINYHHENGLTIYAGINNVFDKLHFEYIGSRQYSVMPADGRNYYAGIKYKF